MTISRILSLHTRSGVYRIIFCALLVVSAMAGGIDTADSAPLPDIKGKLSILLDPTAQMTLPEVLSQDEQRSFKPIAGNGINLGYTREAFWVKLTLPGDADLKAALSLGPNYLDYIDVYVSAPGAQQTNAAFDHFAFGDYRPPSRTGPSTISPAVFVDVAQGLTTVVYIRVANQGTSTQLNLQLDPLSTLPLRHVISGLALGLWFGAMTALLLTQLVFVYFDRKAQYILLALSTLGVILIYFGNLGLSHAFLFMGNGRYNDSFIGVNAWAGLSASAMAYEAILGLRRRSAWLYRLYLTIALCGLAGSGFALANQNLLFGPFGSVLGLLGALLTMVVGFLQMNEEGTVSRLAAVAFAMVGIGATVAMLQRLGVSWLPDWTFSAYGISVLLQTLLLTGAMAVRLREAESQNRHMHQEALASARSAEQVAAKLVVERTRELIEARKAAENALKAEMDSQLRQVRFLEVVSHQYRTPLASIRSNIDSIEFSMGDIEQADRTRIQRIRRAVARLVEILEVNVARSRLQGPSFKPSMDILSISSIVSSAVHRSYDLLNAPDIRLEIADDTVATKVHADQDMLELALINLLENAVKYGGIRDAGWITLSVEKRGDAVVLAVEDQGVGIPASELPHVFENAVRGSNVSSVEGSGLGLFLVAKVMTVHGGQIEIESTKGTTVRLILPTIRP
ncbi:signal transduction histidine kinase [Neorhizobium galegae]|uniref:sensor histidine kinase n=1 Tax=Neorhizobium galegae TaxID=399 RepID=UPI001AE11EE4|nr:sensor histidine kinase [Neorhizobium galegae]MBP2551607.1 signal transduction histidine kinase [Neorhizobium galegae]